MTRGRETFSAPQEFTGESSEGLDETKEKNPSDFKALAAQSARIENFGLENGRAAFHNFLGTEVTQTVNLERVKAEHGTEFLNDLIENRQVDISDQHTPLSLGGYGREFSKNEYLKPAEERSWKYAPDTIRQHLLQAFDEITQRFSKIAQQARDTHVSLEDELTVFEGESKHNLGTVAQAIKGGELSESEAGQRVLEAEFLDKGLQRLRSDIDKRQPSGFYENTKDFIALRQADIANFLRGFADAALENGSSELAVEAYKKLDVLSQVMDDLRTSANEEHKKQYKEIQNIVSRK